MLKIKRIYDKPVKSDGLRVLVDRLWPSGLSKEDAKIDYWTKNIAPSDNLRRWFAHKVERWREFKNRYFGELEDKKEFIEKLKKMAKNSTITLLYAAKDNAGNNAVTLQEFIKRK